MDSTIPHVPPSPRSAVIGAVIAFGFWGTLPVFWKQLSHVGADLTLAHRVAWTMLTVVPLLAWRGELLHWFAALGKRANLLAHAASGLLLTINWGTFIWAANHDRIVECSLGYFINPLLNVFIGSLLLGETLRPLQKISIACAALGVVMQIVALGTFPWIGLILALSMGFYGLARRRSELGSLSGLATETLVFLPLAAAYLVWSGVEGRELWGRRDFHDLTCIGVLGIVTAIPLLGFATRRGSCPFPCSGCSSSSLRRDNSSPECSFMTSPSRCAASPPSPASGWAWSCFAWIWGGEKEGVDRSKRGGGGFRPSHRAVGGRDGGP